MLLQTWRGNVRMCEKCVYKGFCGTLSNEAQPQKKGDEQTSLVLSAVI